MAKKARERVYRRPDLLLLIIPLVFIVDRVIKAYAVDSCLGGFCIKRALNDGAAFGIFSGQTLLLVVVGIAVLILIGSVYKKMGATLKLALVLIASGTIANLFDRLVFGHVIDIFSILGSSSFNVADLSNVIGAGILIWVLIKDSIGKKR